MPESTILKQVMLAGSKRSVLFRNNVGLFTSHDAVKRALYLLDCGMVHQAKQALLSSRPVFTGLVKGASDIIGWTPTVITPEHVGKTLAVFTALECKTDTGRVSEDQKRFINRVLDSGGYAGVCRKPEDVTEITGQ